MILKTYTRIVTEDLEASLKPLKLLVGREPDLRIPLPGMGVELTAIGDFFLISGRREAIDGFVGVLGPAIVDDLDETLALLKQGGARIESPIAPVSTGRILFSEHPSGEVMEWLEWRPEIWEKVKTAGAR